MKKTIEISTLGKTWLFDIDGTIVKHNGYKTDGYDTFLPGAEEFLKAIPTADEIIFLTSRNMEYKEMTENFFRLHGIRYSEIIYGLPHGERILVNDRKPSGLPVSHAVNPNRDEFMDVNFQMNSNL